MLWAVAALLVAAVLGVAFHRHGAGIDDANIGRFAPLGFAVTVEFERLLDELAFVLVDFATERDQANCGRRHEVGLAMGFKPEVARKSVWQLLNKIDDPKLSTLRKFAAALGVEMSVFFPENKKSRSK